MSTAERTLAAEVRAVESGRRAFLRGGIIQVLSTSTPDLHWNVTAEGAPGCGVIFRCEPDDWSLASGRGHQCVKGAPGTLPCLHAGVAARRLERAGLLRWEAGVWLVAEALREPEPQPEDPWKGL